jgi:hypothetical protein
MTKKRNQPSEETPITVLFVDEESLRDKSGRHKYTAVPYEPARHAPLANKFLFWPATSISNGHAILAVGARKESLVNHPHLLTKLIELSIVNQMQIPTGAGEFKNGKVTSWGNTIFGVQTPDELVPVILKALGLD